MTEPPQTEGSPDPSDEPPATQESAAAQGVEPEAVTADAGPAIDESALLFHAALVAGIVPGAGVPISALAFWRAAPGSRWRSRALGLGALDLILALLVGAAALLAPSDLLGDLSTPVAPGGRRARLGAEIDRAPASVGDAGARVISVVPGSPAQVVGVVAGDRIVAMDEAPIEDGAALRTSLDAGAPGTSRHVRLRAQDGSLREVWITPTLDSLAPGASSAEVCAAPSAPSLDEVRDAALEGTPFAIGAALVVLALWGYGWRKGVAGLRFWTGFVLVLTLAPPLGALVASPLCASALAYGARPQTVELALAELSLTLFALAFLYTQRSEADAYADEVPRWGYFQTLAAGFGYLLLWLPRAMMLMLPLVVFSALAGSGAVEAPIGEVLEGARAGPIDAVLTILAAAVLAPVAEEALFRGALNPHLARSMGAWPALVVGAILFGAMHLGGHGMMLVGPLVIGGVLGWARLRSRGLAVPMTLHAMLNGFATSLALLI